jgi:hypothetical protein
MSRATCAQLAISSKHRMRWLSCYIEHQLCLEDFPWFDNEVSNDGDCKTKCGNPRGVSKRQPSHVYKAVPRLYVLRTGNLHSHFPVD